MPSYYINPETTSSVVEFLKTKNDPVKIKTIAHGAGVTKRKAFAVAKNHPEIVQVDPSNVGSGRDYNFFEYKKL